MHILALNSGSSSLKFGLYRVNSTSCAAIVSGEAEGLGSGDDSFHAKDANGRGVVSEACTTPDSKAAMSRIERFLDQFAAPRPDAVGHRIVHGGPELRQHCIVDDRVLDQLSVASPFAPLHTPCALSIMRLARDAFRDVPHVACFDTTFHSTLPDVSRVLPIPKALRLDGIERYGFHGLSCASIVRQLGERLPPRLVIAHLGQGASVTAVKDGRSIDTSMGLTPAGGVMMGTRSGDLDPGVLLHLMTTRGMTGASLSDLINHESGLLGVSGESSDMRQLKKAALTSVDAALAVDMFRSSVSKYVASMVVALGGVDLLVFTGGIGEHDTESRAAICGRLGWFGLALDEGRNASGANPISSEASSCVIQVLPPEEDAQIARHVATLVHAG